MLAHIIATLNAELAIYERSAKSAHEEATHEQSKAENKYDTRGLEASYLARGQSRQAAETEEARRLFESIPLRDFSPEDSIDLGALVELTTNAEPSLYFIGPRAGGMEIHIDGIEVLVITPQSPLGGNLIGKRQGDHWRNTAGGLCVEYRIVGVA